MPLTKGYDGGDGYYYLEFALSTTDVDLENEQVTDECLDDMINQAKSLNSFQCHQYGLDDILGPIVDAWRDTKAMFIKVRVVMPELAAKIKKLVDGGVRLGGSLGALYLEDFVDKGIRQLVKVKLLEGSLTPLPVNWETLGTAQEATKTVTDKCPGGICKQIFKSLHKKYNPEMEVKDMTKTEDNSFEALRSKIWKAIREKYTSKTQDDGLYSGIWTMLTYKDSVIVETWDDSFYEIPYTVDDAGDVEIGDPVEVDKQYVAKKLEIFKIKDIKDISVDEGRVLEDSRIYKINKSLEDGDMLDDKTKKEIAEITAEAVKEATKAGNKELLDGMKEIFKPPQEGGSGEPEGTEGSGGPGASPAIDQEALTKSVTESVLKTLGLEVEEEPEEPNELGTKELDFSKVEERITQNVIKGIRDAREHKRKSKAVGNSDKFSSGEEETSEDKGQKGEPKKMKIKDVASKLAKIHGDA